MQVIFPILFIINFIILRINLLRGIKIYFVIINSFNWSDVPFYGFINGEIKKRLLSKIFTECLFTQLF